MTYLLAALVGFAIGYVCRRRVYMADPGAIEGFTGHKWVDESDRT